MRLKIPVMALALCGFAFPAYADEDYFNIAGKFQQLAGNTNPDEEDWSLHAQATEVYQGYPSFSAAYSGKESLSPGEQWRNTTTGTLFLGRRLWDGAEIYYDPELYEGIGLNNTFGVAGYPNGEANKAGSFPILTGTARAFIRQTFGLGGDTEKIAPAQNQLATIEDVNRITVTFGKLAASDIFDTNTYSNSPRTQFLNWSLMNSAAWDTPANARGYTYGGVVELNQAAWALRYGAFMEPHDSNESDMVFHGGNNLGQVAELEERYTLMDQPGKTHVLIFYNRDRAAYYSDALAMGGDVNTAVNADRDYGHGEYGFALNAEQQLADGIGAFTRLSWNDGKTEEWTFTQVNESAALGVSISGKKWGRDDDTWGLAGVVNAIGREQRHYLESGGYGLIIGDGALSYAPEMIFETYYAIRLCPYATLSPDYQFIAHPAYNEDRGPVDIFAGRLHLEF